MGRKTVTSCAYLDIQTVGVGVLLDCTVGETLTRLQGTMRTYCRRCDPPGGRSWTAPALPHPQPQASSPPPWAPWLSSPFSALCPRPPSRPARPSAPSLRLCLPSQPSQLWVQAQPPCRPPPSQLAPSPSSSEAPPCAPDVVHSRGRRKRRRTRGLATRRLCGRRVGSGHDRSSE